ncbi:MAG: MAPEG family protein [Rhodocyclales bacterium]|nr:MAPEG family protein [Rhodocyclales bacterium]
MNWTYLSLLIAGILPVACAGIAKIGFKNYDNHNPRAWLAKQTGFRARANAAQSNSFEAFPFFVAGVLLAILAGVDHARIDALGIAFVVARIIYIACYVADKATLRSIVWSVGYGCNVALFVLAIMRS